MVSKLTINLTNDLFYNNIYFFFNKNEDLEDLEDLEDII